MRHGDKIKNLGRTASHRAALLSNMTTSLILHKRVFTTLAKAKSLRVYAEPLITRSKEDNTHNRRIVFSYLQSKEAVKELFGAVSDKVAARPGGYTRIIKMPRRLGDAADMAMIELVDFNELYTKEGADNAKKTRRSRRSSGGNKQTSTATAAPVAEETPAAQETPAEENAPEVVEAPATEAPAQEEGNSEEAAA